MGENQIVMPHTATRPSETTAGREWLEHFDRDDRETASLLIDSLEIYDHAEIMTGLRGELLQARREARHLPGALIAVRSLEDLPATDTSDHIAYQTFNPGTAFPALPGSEADIGALSRDLVKVYPESFLSPELTTSELKARTARSLYLLTDYSGSGKQVLRFAETFIRNATIASWISYGLMSIHALTYAASLDASATLRHQRHIQFRSITTAKSARGANWSEAQRFAIERLCLSYSSPSDPFEPLGYGGSFGLYLSNLRVPNNLPQILIRGSGPWPGLFANRSLPEGFYAELPSYRPDQSLIQTLRNLGAPDIADRIEHSRRPVPGLRALAALHLLDYNLSEDQVFGMLHLTERDLMQLRTSLISLGMLTLDNRVTNAGRRELSQARRRSFKRRRADSPSGPVDYIPTQLR